MKIMKKIKNKIPMKTAVLLLTVLSLAVALAGCSQGKAEPEPATLGQSLFYSFKEKAESGSYSTAAELAGAMAADTELFPFQADSMEVEPGYLPGFSQDITGFKQGAFFGPMISTIPFVGYVFQLEEGADVKAFTDSLNENSDLAWNICTQADEKYCEAIDNTVFFVMCPESFEQ